MVVVEVLTPSHHRNTVSGSHKQATATHRHRKLLLTHPKNTEALIGSKFTTPSTRGKHTEKLTIWRSVTVKPTAGA